MVETLVTSSPIKCPADKFYNFFKLNLTDIVKIFPAVYNSGEVTEGELGVVGCITTWTYTIGIGGTGMRMKVLTEVIEDAAKTMKLSALEGDVLVLYKSFACTLGVSEGSAKWTIEYEKDTILSPPPEIYVPVLATLITLVDAYLLIN
ncbi:MLP-like protein 43 isoform X2 [Salvia splendens]|uniref:MLP-like protein 43 isoform X2 n=1 Tax=Salvia splendens TaxID=180675 RepID=UPI001C25D833|nr:MLP-like protein 43 isoform X2 [Salvia splendens]